MKRRLLDLLVCPACKGGLGLRADHEMAEPPVAAREHAQARRDVVPVKPLVELVRLRRQLPVEIDDSERRAQRTRQLVRDADGGARAVQAEADGVNGFGANGRDFVHAFRRSSSLGTGGLRSHKLMLRISLRRRR